MGSDETSETLQRAIALLTREDGASIPELAAQLDVSRDEARALVTAIDRGHELGSSADFRYRILNDADVTGGGPPWRVRYTVWEKSDDACGDRRAGHTGEQETFEGHYNEPTPIDCINAIVYELRGVKSRWELAYVDEIEPAEHSGDEDAFTHADAEAHLRENMDWPQYYVAGEGVDDEGFTPAYYRVEGPNGPVSYLNPSSDAPLATTMYDFAMEAQSDHFRWCEKEETPWDGLEATEGNDE